MQSASLYGGQEVFVWSDCLMDLGTNFLVGPLSALTPSSCQGHQGVGWAEGKTTAAAMTVRCVEHSTGGCRHFPWQPQTEMDCLRDSWIPSEKLSKNPPLSPSRSCALPPPRAGSSPRPPPPSHWSLYYSLKCVSNLKPHLIMSEPSSDWRWTFLRKKKKKELHSVGRRLRVVKKSMVVGGLNWKLKENWCRSRLQWDVDTQWKDRVFQWWIDDQFDEKW